MTRRLLEPGLSMITDACRAEVWDDLLPPPQAEILRRVRGVDGLLCLLTDRIDSGVLNAAGPGLKVISNCAVGVDNVDVDEATRLGIPVGNTPGVLTEATADHTFALLMAAGRRILEGSQQVHSGGWKTWSLDGLLGVDIAGATLGIIGFGRIGQAVARRASGFGMRVLYTDPASHSDDGMAAQKVTLETLLGEADFVSLHCPLTPETSNLINRRSLALMKPTAVLVNTSRGAVIDQQALYEALEEKRIFAAALDVSDPEPMPDDDPLLSLQNCLVTPHIASASRSTRMAMSSMAAENLIAGLKGLPLPNCVNPQVYKGRE